MIFAYKVNIGGIIVECTTLTEQLAHWAHTCPDKVWLRDLAAEGQTTYTWSQAQTQINAIAAALERRKLHVGYSVLLTASEFEFV